jgi:chromosome segregation ATPase
MPTKQKKHSSSVRKPVRRPAKTTAQVGIPAMASAQLKQLRKTVKQLKSRLEKEAERHTAAAKVITEAKKAREGLMLQMKMLRDEGSRLTKELKRALGDADKREAARRQAVGKIAELRAELTHRTEELKRKSEELARLAIDSAGRAKEIIMSPGATTASPPEAEPSSTEETESVSSDTLRREESPNESSIEREVHPERRS